MSEEPTQECDGEQPPGPRRVEAADRVKIARFRGHPNWREYGPGVDHGQKEEAA